MTVELRHLRCFLAIAEELNFTRAAAQLRLSQPVLSRTLAQLELHLATQLVDRSTHHVELTGAGETFALKAAAVLAAFEAAIDPSSMGEWPLRLGYAWSALGGATPGLLRTWAKNHPDIPLKLLRSDDRTAGLAAGLVDAALVRGSLAEIGSAAGALTAALITTEERVAALPAGNPLADRERLSLADLVDQVLAVNTVSGTTSLDMWPQHERPTRTLDVGNTDDWLMVIASGSAFGITSTATAQMYPHPGIAYRPMVDAPRLPVHLVWRSAFCHPAVPQLLALMKELVAQ